MSTAFSILRNIFALIGFVGCVLLGVLVALNAADTWLARKRHRHLGEIHRAQAGQRLQEAVDKASSNQGGGEL